MEQEREVIGTLDRKRARRTVLPSHDKRFTIDALKHFGNLAVILLIAVCVDVATRQFVANGGLDPASFAYRCIAAVTMTIEACHSVLLIAIVVRTTWDGLLDVFRGTTPPDFEPPNGDDENTGPPEDDNKPHGLKAAGTTRRGSWVKRVRHGLRRLRRRNGGSDNTHAASETDLLHGVERADQSATPPPNIVYVNWRKESLLPMEPAGTRVSRRGILAGAIAAGLSGVGLSALTSVINTRQPTVLDSGHVLRIPLRDGVMHAARNTLFEIDRRHAAQTVHLRAGQASFDLWDRARSLTRVLTPWGEIAVTAARFGVLALESMLQVAVIEGSVRVISSDASVGDVVLRHGQKLTLQSGVAQVASIAPAQAAREFAWTQGDLYFDGESLLEAASTFNRFNVLQIVPSPAISQLSVGTHRCAVTEPQRFVDRFVADWGLATRKSGNVIHIFKRDEVPKAP